MTEDADEHRARIAGTKKPPTIREALERGYDRSATGSDRFHWLWWTLSMAKVWIATRSQRAVHRWAEMEYQEGQDWKTILEDRDSTCTPEEAEAKLRSAIETCRLKPKDDNGVQREEVLALWPSSKQRMDKDNGKPPRPTPARPSDIESWYQERRAGLGYPSTEKDDWAAMQKEFGSKARREPLRDLRRKDSSLCKRGPRGPRKSAK